MYSLKIVTEVVHFLKKKIVNGPWSPKIKKKGVCWELINILPSNILQNMLSSGDKDDNDADAHS